MRSDLEIKTPNDMVLVMRALGQISRRQDPCSSEATREWRYVQERKECLCDHATFRARGYGDCDNAVVWAYALDKMPLAEIIPCYTYGSMHVVLCDGVTVWDPTVTLFARTTPHVRAYPERRPATDQEIAAYEHVMAFASSNHLHCVAEE